jgi:nitroimidazol reductase NimA-like FMN-containing flavoprotein (pyridoxamine 5'-phosphate oxidase superfamily)
MEQEMRRKERAMNRKDSERLLETAAVGRLGTFNDDPYIVPVNFVYENGKIWFHCAKEGRKIRALIKSPRVCFEVDEFLGLKEGEKSCSFGAFFRSVIAFGDARIVESMEQKREILTKLMAKYTGRKQVWLFEDAELNRVEVVEIAIAQMTGKSRLP